MKKHLMLSLAISALAVGASFAAFAQDAAVPDHPRVNEIDQRLNEQQQRIDAGEKAGDITPKQAAQDEKRDARIAKKAQADEARHNGHLTPREYKNLNKGLNKNGKKIHKQRVHGEKKKAKAAAAGAPAGQ